MSNNKKKLTPSRVLLFGTIIKNPILVQVIGLCPAVAASSSLTVALLLSFVITVMLIVCELLASAVLKPLSSWFRVAVYMIIGLLFICPLMYILDAAGFSVVNNAGVYLPLMAASSIVALRCEKFAVKRSVALSFYDAVATGAGVSIVLILSGFIRELFGAGTIAGRTVFEYAPIPALTMPFGGFLVLGFLAAFFKWFISTFLGEYSHDMAFKIKKPSRKRNGLAPKPSTSPSSPAKKSSAPPISKTHNTSSSAFEISTHDIKTDKESFSNFFYNSMSDDIFSEDDVFSRIVGEVESTNTKCSIDFAPETNIANDSPSATPSVESVANSREILEDTESAIKPVDLDPNKDNEISPNIATNDTLAADDERGHTD